MKKLLALVLTAFLFLPGYAQLPLTKAGKAGPAAGGGGASILTGLQLSCGLANLTDSSTNGFTLTNNGTVTFTSGHIGNAGTFNGTNFLSLADNSQLSFTSSFSLWAWVKPSDFSGFEGIITKRDDGSNKYILHMEDNQVVFAVNDSVNAAIDLSGVGISANTWFFVLCWFDDTANTINILVNNTHLDSQSFTGTPTDTDADFEIGAFSGGSLFTGQIDATGAVNRVTTSDERTNQLFNSGTGREFPYS